LCRSDPINFLSTLLSDRRSDPIIIENCTKCCINKPVL